MKIAYLVDKASPFYVGGYEVRAERLSAYLAKEHQVRIYTSMPIPEVRIGNVDYVRVCSTAFQPEKSGERSLVHSALFAAALRADPFKNWDPDVVIIESIPYVHLATMRPWASRSHGRLYILNVNEAWRQYSYQAGLLATPSKWTIGRLLKSGVELCSITVTVSEATFASLKQNYSARTIVRIPNGIDSTVVTSVSREPIRDREYDFVTVGRLVRIKRLEVLIEALALMKRLNKWTGKAAIIGEGPLRAELESRVAELGLGSQVAFLGMIDEPTKYRVLADSKIFVLPSEREGFSIATLEAMGVGLPAVVARTAFDEVFGTSEFVREDVNGIYYPVNDSIELARALDDLLGDPGRMEALSSGAKSVASTYTWDAAGSKLAELLSLHTSPTS